jgi:hypothetical protein
VLNPLLIEHKKRHIFFNRPNNNDIPNCSRLSRRNNAAHTSVHAFTFLPRNAGCRRKLIY